MKSIGIGIFILTIASGQPPLPPPGVDGPLMKGQGERFELMKMWRLTEELGLSEDQAEKFFPRHNSLVDELEEISGKQKELMVGLYESVDKGEKVTDKDVDKIMSKVLDMERTKLSKKEDFVKTLDDILTPEQKAKYVVFEVRFRKHLLRQIREHRGMKRKDYHSPPGKTKPGPGR